MTGIRLTTPQFEREDGKEPRPAPDREEDWEALREATDEELANLGLRKWSDDLWLFPHEWYDEIPVAFRIETINDRTEKFSPGTTDNDKRFGVLPYGVRNGG